MRLELKHNKGLDGKVRYYWVLCDGRRYVAYIGREPVIDRKKAQEIAHKLNISPDELANVAGLEIQGRLRSGKEFESYFKRAILGDEKLSQENFCSFFNSPLEVLQRKGIPKKQAVEIAQHIQHRVAPIIRDVIVALEQWQSLRKQARVKTEQEYQVRIEQARRRMHPKGEVDLSLYLNTPESVEKRRQIMLKIDPLFAAHSDLQDAIFRLGDIPTLLLKRKIEMKDSGTIDFWFAYQAEAEALQQYGVEDIALDIGLYLEHFKTWLEKYHSEDSFPIGICQECGNLFVKRRKDQLYCSPTHKARAFYKRKVGAA